MWGFRTVAEGLLFGWKSRAHPRVVLSLSHPRQLCYDFEFQIRIPSFTCGKKIVLSLHILCWGLQTWDSRSNHHDSMEKMDISLYLYSMVLLMEDSQDSAKAQSLYSSPCVSNSGCFPFSYGECTLFSKTESLFHPPFRQASDMWSMGCWFVFPELFSIGRDKRFYQKALEKRVNGYFMFNRRFVNNHAWLFPNEGYNKNISKKTALFCIWAKTHLGAFS